ncbi:peptidoglycan recognition protein family protein [Bacillus cereus]
MEIKRVNLTFQDELVPLEKVNKLIIHHTAEDGWDVYKTHEFHQTVRGWSGIGYNYFIEKDGTVVEGRGLHIWSAREDHEPSYNWNMVTEISINTIHSPASECIIFFMQMFMKQLAIKKENILGHRELEGVTKSCPGNRFSMVELRKILS